MNDPTKLPTQIDFDPNDGDLDAQCAWRNFGGLTLEEAKEKFRKCPEVYQEDFMFMGGKAFAYYYPVIDSFLRETAQRPLENRDDREAWILPQCIKSQFHGPNFPYVGHLIPDVLSLCRFVRQNLPLFGANLDEMAKIDRQWVDLQQHLEAIRG